MALDSKELSHYSVYLLRYNVLVLSLFTTLKALNPISKLVYLDNRFLDCHISH